MRREVEGFGSLERPVMNPTSFLILSPVQFGDFYPSVSILALPPEYVDFWHHSQYESTGRVTSHENDRSPPSGSGRRSIFPERR